VTPLLILANEGDANVKSNQGKEWYYSLARLGKRAWMLSYDGEGHMINKENNQLDYSIRLSQFLDHYLKGAASPKWMTQEPGRSR